MGFIFANLRNIDYRSFTYLNQLAKNDRFYGDFFLFFGDLGILFVALALIYLVFRNRINCFFTALVAMIISLVSTFILFLFIYDVGPYATFVETNKLTFRSTLTVFPSGQTFLAFAIAISILLYGHRKLGFLTLIVAILIGVSQIAIGAHYPSDVFYGVLIGIFSALISYNTVTYFEKYWQKNSLLEEDEKDSV